MKLFSRTAIVLAAVALSFGPSLVTNAVAKDYVDASTHLGLTAPDEWKASEGEQLMLSAPDDQAHIIIMKVDAGELDAALNAMDEELGKTIDDVKMEGDAVKGETNGLPEVHASGTGKHGETDVHFSVAVVDAGDDCLIVLAFGTAEGLKEHSDTVNAIFGSIKKD